jgi:hypothetical protein
VPRAAGRAEHGLMLPGRRHQPRQQKSRQRRRSFVIANALLRPPSVVGWPCCLAAPVAIWATGIVLYPAHTHHAVIAQAVLGTPIAIALVHLMMVAVLASYSDSSARTAENDARVRRNTPVLSQSCCHSAEWASTGK